MTESYQLTVQHFIFLPSLRLFTGDFCVLEEKWIDFSWEHLKAFN